MKTRDDLLVIRDFADFYVACRTVHGFPERLQAQRLVLKSNMLDDANEDIPGSAVEKVDKVRHDLDKLYQTALNGDAKAFGLLLFLTQELVTKLNASARMHPGLAQQFARRLFLWPGFFSIEASLNHKMQDILEKEFVLGKDIKNGMPLKFGGALENPHRQFAYWIVLYMWFLRRYEPSTVVKNQAVKDCLALPEYAEQV